MSSRQGDKLPGTHNWERCVAGRQSDIWEKPQEKVISVLNTNQFITESFYSPKKLLQKKETHANNKNIFIHFLNNKYRTEGSQQPKS